MSVPIRIGLAALMLAGTTTAASARDTPAVRLDKALAGRVAGKPVDCIQQYLIRSTRVFTGIGILYEMTGGDYYLNRPRSGAAFLDDDDILVTDTHSSQLCGVDIVRLVDNASHMPSGSLGLGPFVPYTRPGKR